MPDSQRQPADFATTVLLSRSSTEARQASFQRGKRRRSLTRSSAKSRAVGQVKRPCRALPLIIDAAAEGPEERYASTRDLSRDVRSVREHLSESATVSSVSGPRVASPARPKRRWLSWIAGAAALVASFAAGAWAQKQFGKTSPPSFQQITFGSGTIQSARFAPDGQTIVYSASWDGNPRKLFLKHPSSPEALRSICRAPTCSRSSLGEWHRRCCRARILLVRR